MKKILLAIVIATSALIGGCAAGGGLGGDCQPCFGSLNAKMNYERNYAKGAMDNIEAQARYRATNGGRGWGNY